MAAWESSRAVPEIAVLAKQCNPIAVTICSFSGLVPGKATGNPGYSYHL